MSVEVSHEAWEPSLTPGIKGNHLIILIKLADWSNKQGILYAYINDLAYHTRTSVRTAQRCLQDLMNRGYLELLPQEGQGRGGRQPGGAGSKNWYRVHIPSFKAQAGKEGCQFVTPKGDKKGDKMAPLGVTNRAEKGDKSDILDAQSTPVNVLNVVKHTKQASHDSIQSDFLNAPLPSGARALPKVPRCAYKHCNRLPAPHFAGAAYCEVHGEHASQWRDPKPQFQETRQA